MRSGTLFSLAAILSLCFFPARLRAGEVHGEPSFDSPQLLEMFLERKCSFAFGNLYHRFGADHRYTGTGAAGERMKGTWQIDGHDLVVSAEGEGKPCEEGPFEPCDDRWQASFIWRGLRTNGVSVLEVDRTERGGLVYLCGPGRGCETLVGTQCFPVEAVQVRPGSRNQRLYRRLLRALREGGLGEFAVVRGPRTVDPRRVTEIWYQAGAEASAHAIARRLEPLVGPVAPRAWESGGPYRVTIIVGRKRGTQLPRGRGRRWE